MLERGWHPDPFHRPPAYEFLQVLQSQIIKMDKLKEREDKKEQPKDKNKAIEIKKQKKEEREKGKEKMEKEKEKEDDEDEEEEETERKDTDYLVEQVQQLISTVTKEDKALIGLGFLGSHLYQDPYSYFLSQLKEKRIEEEERIPCEAVEEIKIIQISKKNYDSNKTGSIMCFIQCTEASFLFGRNQPAVAVSGTTKGYILFWSAEVTVFLNCYFLLFFLVLFLLMTKFIGQDITPTTCDGWDYKLCICISKRK